MMMPANYSVIAENEMTYVNGGASFIDAIGAVTAPIWNLDNVKAFSTNIVTLILHHPEHSGLRLQRPRYQG